MSPKVDIFLKNKLFVLQNLRIPNFCCTFVPELKKCGIMEVFVGNPKVNVSIVAKPWSEGHVARISSARVCGQMVSNHYSVVAQ